MIENIEYEYNKFDVNLTQVLFRHVRYFDNKNNMHICDKFVTNLFRKNHNHEFFTYKIQITSFYYNLH